MLAANMAGEPDSAALDSAQGRELLQSRLAGFARFGMILNALFFPVGLVMRGMLMGESSGAGAGFLRGAAIWQGSVILLNLVIWLLVRRQRRSLRALHVLDAVLVVSVATGFSLIMRNAPVWVRPEMSGLFLVSILLMIRAAIVPSTAVRSVWISLASLTPLLVSTYLYHRAHPQPAPIPGPAALSMSVAGLGSATVIVSAMVSRTVHRLRERVRQAMQLGQYTLERKIGEGGMGVVWKASHAMLRRPTAVKLLPAGRAGEHNLARFEREVQLTSVLTHPNTVAIYDYGRTPDGVFYYAMEYLEGLDLQTLVEQDGPQEPARVIHLLLQICGALEEAHGLGLVHRDVKPANVLLCERPASPDLVKVLDFGLVKQLDGAAVSDGVQSIAGEVVGTAHYLSPEAITTPSAVDARSDLYAVGGLAYFLLTGAAPFTGRTLVEICGHHLHSPPMPPSQRLGRPLPPALESAVLSCLAKSPADRPRDAGALRDLLARAGAANPWSREEAAAWWRERGRPLRVRLAERPAAASTGSPTVMRAR
jgi:hypothetical protein